MSISPNYLLGLNLVLLVCALVGLVMALTRPSVFRPVNLALILVLQVAFIAVGLLGESGTRMQIFLYTDSERYLAGSRYVFEHFSDLSVSWKQMRQILGTSMNGEIYTFSYGLFCRLTFMEPSLASSVVFNFLLSLGTLLLMRKIAVQFGLNIQIRNVFLFLYCLNPVHMILFPALLKETFDTFLGVLFVWSCIVLLESHRLLPVMGVLLVSFLTLFERAWILPILGGPMLVVWIYKEIFTNNTKIRVCWGAEPLLTFSKRYNRLLILAAGAAVCTFGLITIYQREQISMIGLFLHYVQDMGGDFYASASIWERLALFPLAIVRLSFVPFPNLLKDLLVGDLVANSGWHNSAMLLAMPFHVVTAAFLVIGLLFFLFRFRGRPSLTLYLIPFLSLLLMSTLLSPFHYRVRETLLPFAVLLASWSLVQCCNRYKAKTVIAAASFLFIICFMASIWSFVNVS